MPIQAILVSRRFTNTQTFSVTFKLDWIDLSWYSASTVAASFFLSLLMTKRFALSEFQDIVSLFSPVTSCSFLWEMKGKKKKKFMSILVRVKAMLCTSSCPASATAGSLELTPLLCTSWQCSMHFLTAPPGGKSSHQKTAQKHTKAALVTYICRGQVLALWALPSHTFASNELSATRASTSISSSLTRRKGEAAC